MPPKHRVTLPKTHRRVAGQPATTSMQARRISRREREEKQKRQLFLGVGFAGALVVLILAGFAMNEYWFKPRHVLASVDGTDIRRRDYWKYRAVDLANQASQYAAIANSPYVDSNEAQQYAQFAQQTSAEIDQVWGSTDLDEATLQKMIDDLVYLKSLDDFGIIITDKDVQDYIDQQFQPPDAPIFTPTPTPTLIPERAEWATQTAEALYAPEATPILDEASPMASPETGASPVGQAATPVGASSPAVTVSGESVSPVASPEASPVSGTPEAATPQATPELSPTPNQEQARQTATANFASYQEAIFDRAHLSRADYIRLIVKPAIARERIDQALTANIGQSAEQVHAAHILVDTKDLADAIYTRLTLEGADFAGIATDQSVDSGTAPNGGDLGWFTRGQMVAEFEAVAFSTQPGQISQPVQTKFGWHIIKVLAYEPNRAMTDEQISQVKSATTSKWLDARKADLSISSEIKPTATSAGPENFVPPPDAPPAPTPTPEVIVEASPEASPVVELGTPIASPAATPVS